MEPGGTVPQGEAGVPIRALRVEVLEGPDTGTSKTTTLDTLSVGTARGNDLVLTDPTVSRFHVELERRGDKILLKDHGSTNGTHAGGVWLREALITPGTKLRIGSTVVRVADGETVSLELYAGERISGLLGRSQPMRQLMARIERVAVSNASVLVLGETGAGKEVVARAIHDSSPRAGKPFEAVDCGSMLPTLIASELFGHERGAFTGAEDRHIGAFERAGGGTLFLDEIGELPPALQTTLLGALERRSFRRVGGKQAIQVDVRVVCATNRDLRTEVNAGNFRADLYYRIAVVLLRVPPLRERREDIPLLVQHFLREAGWEGRASDLLPLDELAKHGWPGNVRELRNVVEATVVLGEAPSLRAEPQGASAAPSDVHGELEPWFNALTEIPYTEARTALLDRFEQRYVEAVLDRARGNVSLAARNAKMDRSHLTRLLKKLGLRGREAGDSGDSFSSESGGAGGDSSGDN